jgi:phosphate/sulfate permease
MYTATLTLVSGAVAYAVMSLYDVAAVTAITFVFAMVGFGLTADIIRVESTR